MDCNVDPIILCVCVCGAQSVQARQMMTMIAAGKSSTHAKVKEKVMENARKSLRVASGCAIRQHFVCVSGLEFRSSILMR